MAYENGNSIYSYFDESLKRYSKDNSIFTKAFQIISSYKPHEIKYNINDLNITLNALIGHSLDHLAFSGKYIRIEIENKEKLLNGEITQEQYEMGAIWNRNEAYHPIYTDKSNIVPQDYSFTDLTSIYSQDLLNSFEIDLTSFYCSITDYINFYYMMDKSSKSLTNIKASYSYRNLPSSIPLIRNDGEEFEIDIHEIHDIEYIIRTMNSIKEINNNYE